MPFCGSHLSRMIYCVSVVKNGAKRKRKKRYRYKSVIDRLVVSCILICNAFINSLSTCNTRPTVIAFLALPLSTDFRTRAKRPVKRFPWKKISYIKCR